MKQHHKFTFVALVALLVLSFAGCGELNAISADPTTASTAPTTVTEAPSTQITVPSTEATAPTTPTTEPSAPTTPTAPTEGDLSYLVQIPWKGISILSEPIYDAQLVRTIEPGTYTIVEETTDEEGNLWGKLKSGLGWIDLTQIKAYQENTPPMIANHADPALLDSENYHHYIADTSPYAVKVAFYSTEKLTNIKLYSMTLVETLERDKELCSLVELTPDKPFVAELSFPGDMSMFEISFTDANGKTCIYRLGISGRNGTIMFYAVNA